MITRAARAKWLLSAPSELLSPNALKEREALEASIETAGQSKSARRRAARRRRQEAAKREREGGSEQETPKPDRRLDLDFSEADPPSNTAENIPSVADKSAESKSPEADDDNDSSSEDEEASEENTAEVQRLLLERIGADKVEPRWNSNSAGIMGSPWGFLLVVLRERVRLSEIVGNQASTTFMANVREVLLTRFRTTGKPVTQQQKEMVSDYLNQMKTMATIMHGYRRRPGQMMRLLEPAAVAPSRFAKQMELDRAGSMCGGAARMILESSLRLPALNTSPPSGTTIRAAKFATTNKITKEGNSSFRFKITFRPTLGESHN